MTLAIYKRLCPSCYGRIEDTRLKNGLLCSECEKGARERFPALCEAPYIRKNAILDFCHAELNTEKFRSFFKEKIGSLPYPLQLSWARRIFLKESFALVAPTGVGKTTFGILMASFLNKRSYIIVPTRLLVKDVYKRLISFNLTKKIIAYTGKKKEKEAIGDGDYDILVTTTNFLARNRDLLEGKKFDFVFVDDVDSLLKTGRNIETVLKLIGVSDDEIKIAETLVKLRMSLVKNPDSMMVRKRISKLKNRLSEGSGKRGILVASSATLTPKTKKIKIVKEILGFEIGKEVSALRNIEDIVIFPETSLNENLLRLINHLKNGIFIFVSSVYGKDKVIKIKDLLNKHGIITITYEEFNEENRKAFKEGKINAVVGLAISRNPIVRGIDLPLSVKYAVFYGVPRIEFPVKSDNISSLYGLLGILKAFALKKDEEEIEKIRNRMQRYITGKHHLQRESPEIIDLIKNGRKLIENLLSRKEVLDKIENSKDTILKRKGDDLFISIGDATTYIQASGRTSRLYRGILLKGASFLLIDDRKAFFSLKKRLFYLGIGIEFRVLSDREGIIEEDDLEYISHKELEKIVREIEDMRVSCVLSGANQVKVNLESALLIVESPNKARTIASFFGKPLKREVNGFILYEISIEGKVLLIVATRGHVFDLVTKEGVYGVIDRNDEIIPVYDTIKYCRNCNEQMVDEGCSCKNTFIEDKIELVRALRKVGFEVDTIYLAHDPDTEGEKIAWDIYNTLGIFPRNIKRVEFHEVTRHAILSAIKNPSDVDEFRVMSQILRRIADRWIGFSLTEKLKAYFKEYNLSAGRVQTPVLGWIIERTRKSKEKRRVLVVKTPEIDLNFELEESQRKVDIKLVHYRVKNKGEETLPTVLPFNTPSVLKESSHKLGFSAQKTMGLLQDLFEAGLITYHRTDSIRVSSWGVHVAKRYIKERFGGEFIEIRTFSSSEGAHECIRPTEPVDAQELINIVKLREALKNIEKDHILLYELIFNRFMASQMRRPLVEKGTLEFMDETGRLKVEKELILGIIEDGYNLILPQPVFNLKGDSGTLAVLAKRIQNVPLVLPFTQGELVDTMRKKGIGRPSTYAKIIDTLLKRRYVVEIRGRLYSTRKGEKVYNFLKGFFGDIVSEKLTYEIERMQDEVEFKRMSYHDALMVIRNLRVKIENTAV